MISLAEVLKDYCVVELSHVLEEGVPRPQVPFGHVPWKSHARGDAFNTFMVLVFEHAGTHVDAPVHLGGVDGPALDRIPAEVWMGELVAPGFRGKGDGEAVAVREVREWEAEHGGIGSGAIVLLDFGWAEMWTTGHGVDNQPYPGENPGLGEEAAAYLAERGVKLVGGDVLTIDVGSDHDEPSHRVLLPRGVLVLENATNLDQVPPRGSFFVGLPLKIRGWEGVSGEGGGLRCRGLSDGYPVIPGVGVIEEGALVLNGVIQALLVVYAESWHSISLV